MTQQTAAARPLRTSAARPTRRPLQVVSAAPARGSGGFVALCVVLLFAGLVGVLLLNTTMAKGSFELQDLQNRAAALTDTQETLSHDIDAVSAPAELARAAMTLGMVPSPSVAFLRLSDGAILGRPTPAHAGEGFSVATGPSVPAPSSTSASVTPAAPTKPATTKPTTKKPTTKPATKKPTTKSGTPTPTPTH